MITPTAQEVFSSWLAACQADAWEPLTEQAAEPYAYIWQSWARTLGETPWDQATGIQVLAFLESAVQPGRQNLREVTRRRYWRVLDRVYEHGMLNGWASANPAQEVAHTERPAQENPTGAILSPRMRHALETGIGDASDPLHARNKALMLMLMQLGPTSQELCDLQLQDLVCGTVNFTGPRAAQNRSLPISDELAKALSDYLAQRDWIGTSNKSDFLFVSQAEPRMTAQTVQRVTRKYLTYTAHKAALPVPVQLGPHILRNTAILQWLLEGIPMLVVLQQAGLKSPKALVHLRQHLPSRIRSIVNASAHSE